MSKKISEITKEKILSLIKVTESDPFSNDEYIKLKKEINILLKEHIKKIYPKNIPIVLPNDSYENYLINFLSYIESQKNILDDLWMIIGGSNQGENLERFKSEYDIIIGTSGEMNINEQQLVGLAFNNIYSDLSQNLSHKFSKIIYDYSVTKFIAWDIFEDLKYIKKLISLYGILYIDVIVEVNNQPAFSLKLNLKNMDLYYVEGQSHEAPASKLRSSSLREPNGILKPNQKDEFKLYAAISYAGRQIKNSYKLFDIMDENGFITQKKLDEHIRNNPKDDYNYHVFFDQNLEYVDIVIQKLKKIFTEDKFIVSHIKDTKTYPNNPLPGSRYSEIKYYYEIIRIAL
jgi:hypothetical protein